MDTDWDLLARTAPHSRAGATGEANCVRPRVTLKSQCWPRWLLHVWDENTFSEKFR